MHALPSALARRLTLIASASVLAVAATGGATASASDSGCTRVAAPGGSDSAAGTESSPFASVQRLVNSLGPGEVGCLRQGTYAEQNVTVNNGGTGEDSRVVLRSYPGERAKLSGRLYVSDRANYVTVE